MITAMQSAKLKAAESLTKAIDELLDAATLICFGTNDSLQIRDAINDIDAIRAKILPENSGPAKSRGDL